MSIQKLNHTHEAIMNWLLQNPEKSLRECADSFGFTQAWLSTVIHSDAFQTQYRALVDSAHSRVVADVPSRMARIADIALDKLADMVEKSESPDYILETSDKILNRLGYAPRANAAPAAPAVTNNIMLVSKETLALARSNFGTATIAPVKTPELIEHDNPAAE